MYIDAQLKFSDAQAVTSSAASTNIVDLGAARDIGMSCPLHVLVKVDTSATASGAATVQVQLQCATDAAFTAPVTVEQTDAIAKTALVSGYGFYLALPPGLNKRYVRLNYVVGTGPLTAGAFTAAVVMGVQSAPTYPAPYQA